MRPLEAGLRTLFNDPSMSISGVYTSAAGDSQPVRVIYVEAMDPVLGGAAIMGTTATQDAAEVLQSEVPEKPTRGAMLAFDGRTFAIRSGATSQKRGLTWRIVLADA